jgi:hypothetical protein
VLILALARHGETAPWPGSGTGSGASAASENWLATQAGAGTGRGQPGTSAADARQALDPLALTTARDRLAPAGTNLARGIDSLIVSAHTHRKAIQQAF